MRALPLRRIATSALCAMLLLGAAGPALAHDDASRDKPGTAPRAPAPDANALAAQTQQLHALGGALNTVSELLTAVLKAKDNKLPPEDVKKHTEAVKKALEALAAAKPPAPKAATDPAAAQGPAAPAVRLPQMPALPQAPAVPGAQTPAAPPPAAGAPGRGAVPLDPKADALAALQKSVDALPKATGAGDKAAVLAQAPKVVPALVNVVAATMVGGGLPAPSLPGLPPAPKAP